MRVSILIGLVLVAVGVGALYQVRNGFFMATVGAVTYAPPSDSEELGSEQNAGNFIGTLS